MKPKTSVLRGNKANRKWHLIDLDGKILGRVSTEIASLLMGKNKPTFSYHRDDGDYVVCVNAAKIQVTGKKLRQKSHFWHTPWPGHLKSLTWEALLKKDPRQLIYLSVANMLPKNRLRDSRLKRLKVFTGLNHPYGDKFKKDN
ncbi:MAG TPA: 50S ribosomal protein L13 [Candidatus Woesebacteria bacterium]|nr:50S ribosomal protein L13 [Candidatus Woesebacteria bacterium]HRT39779.1 50S ribosomal protein L13 [Candidatus Woesebacteria bacterium]